MGLFGSSWSDSRVKELYKTAKSGNRPMEVRLEALESLGEIAHNDGDDASDEAIKALSKIMNSGNRPDKLRKRAARIIGEESPS